LGKGLSGGQVFENAIANQLARLGQLNYFEKSRSLEIDFIVDGQTAYEVKETPTPQHLRKLQYAAAQLGLPQSQLIGRYSTGQFKDFVWGGNVF